MFRVFILIPLLPGFEGNIGVTDSSTLLAVLNWTLLSISRGDHSLIANLKKAGVDDIRRYLCVFIYITCLFLTYQF
jgi:phospholipase D1/2